MKSKNKITNAIIFLGVFLFTFALTGFNLSDYSFKENTKEYLMFIGFVICIIIYYYRLNQEKK